MSTDSTTSAVQKAFVFDAGKNCPTNGPSVITNVHWHFVVEPVRGINEEGNNEERNNEEGRVRGFPNAAGFKLDVRLAQRQCGRGVGA